VEILLTQRELDVKMLPFLEQAQKLIEGALAIGFEAPPQRTFGFKKEEKAKEYADYPCPVCKSRVIKNTTKTGKAFEKCEKQVYNWKTKQNEGCSYVLWK
jgi:hypothetical protein